MHKCKRAKLINNTERMNHMKKTLKRIFCLILMFALLVPELALADSYKAQVLSNNVGMYEKATTGSKKIATLNKNATVMVQSISGSFAKVTYSSKTGYIQLKELRSTQKVKVYAKKSANVYATASTKGAVLETVSIDYPLYKVGINGNFFMVDDGEGKFTGYISKDAVSETPVNKYVVTAEKKSYKNGSTTTVTPSAVLSKQSYIGKSMDIAKYRAHLAYIAEQKAGCLYNKSGNGKTTFSNLNFVTSTMSAMGYSIPTSISGIAHSGNGAYVSRAKLQVGDIVCFDCDDTDDLIVDHIGIYLGNGWFIHASVNAGCVCYSSMSSGYYKNNFCWGRRYVTK